MMLLGLTVLLRHMLKILILLMMKRLQILLLLQGYGGKEIALWSKSADTKRLILPLFHDHPAGHYGVTKTLKAVKVCFYRPNADAEVRNYTCNCPSCQVQTHSAKPAGGLQPLDVPLGTLSLLTTLLVCLSHLRAIMLLLSLWIS